MPDASATLMVICLALGGAVALIAVFMLSGIGKKHIPNERIPPPQTFYLEQNEAMARVRKILAEDAVVGCRWRITYDRAGEGRLQARVYGTPSEASGKEPVDILLNMLFHKIESNATELEWSYVVMSGKSTDADLLVAASNAAFKASLASNSQTAR